VTSSTKLTLPLGEEIYRDIKVFRKTGGAEGELYFTHDSKRNQSVAYQ
jgi:hypothetical protein